MTLALPEPLGDAVSPVDPLADADHELETDAEADSLEERGGLPLEVADIECDEDGLPVLVCDSIDDTLAVVDREAELDPEKEAVALALGDVDIVGDALNVALALKEPLEEEVRLEESLADADCELVAEDDADWLRDCGALPLEVPDAVSDVTGLPVLDCDGVDDTLAAADRVEEPDCEKEEGALALPDADVVCDALCVALALPELLEDAVGPAEPLVDVD